MKANLSKNTVKELVLMLDDAYQLEDSEPDFNYIRIMKNLVLANKYRDDEGLELSSESVRWLFSVLDTLMYKTKPSRTQVSQKSRDALSKEMKKQRW